MGRSSRYYATRNWHFVDLELDGVDLDRACRRRPPQAAGIPASRGREDDCVITKIAEFRSELSDARIGSGGRLLALRFLLHLVGDLHQPLHAADDHDQGGNRKIVSVPGIGIEKLHQAWDTEFVARLGPTTPRSRLVLIARITDDDRRQWSRGTTGGLGARKRIRSPRAHAYGLLPPGGECGGTPGGYPGRRSGRRVTSIRAFRKLCADAIAATAEAIEQSGSKARMGAESGARITMVCYAARRRCRRAEGRR